MVFKGLIQIVPDTMYLRDFTIIKCVVINIFSRERNVRSYNNTRYSPLVNTLALFHMLDIQVLGAGEVAMFDQ